MGDDQGRAVEFPDDISHGEGLAGTGYTKKRLVPVAGLDRLQ